jgi:hypothetical protein
VLQLAEVTSDDLFPEAKFLINSWSKLSIGIRRTRANLVVNLVNKSY